MGGVPSVVMGLFIYTIFVLRFTGEGWKSGTPKPLGDKRAVKGGSISTYIREWPGNLRELDNALVLALALAEGSCIEVQDLPEALRERRLATTSTSNPTSVLCAGESSWQQVLQACGDNVSAAARQLGISRSTLHRYIKRAGLAQQDSARDTGCDT